MSRKHNRWSAPLSGSAVPANSSHILELISDEEKAGQPLPPPVEFLLPGRPVEVDPAVLVDLLAQVGKLEQDVARMRATIEAALTQSSNSPAD